MKVNSRVPLEIYMSLIWGAGTLEDTKELIERSKNLGEITL